MQTIFEKCPFKENGKLLKLFCLILRGLNLPVGSDAPPNKILRGAKSRECCHCIDVNYCNQCEVNLQLTI
jgi:hypothetical protein